jgi:hypothetical protein
MQPIAVDGDETVARHLRARGAEATHLRPTMDRNASIAERQINGIPVDTGRLERSVKVLRATNDGFDIGTDVSYARYVFAGTKYVEARPPRINGEAIAGRTAQDIARELR